MQPDYQAMQDLLMKELRLYHYPIAITFFFDQPTLDTFMAETDYYLPAKNMTFCQMELAARMRGDTVLTYKEQMGCSNSLVSFGWKEIDEKEIATQAKYTVDLAQAERFMRSKPSLPMGKLLAIATGPLAGCKVPPSVIHFYCDNLQSYHLGIDYMAATDTHPLRPMHTMSSSACGGAVYSYNESAYNNAPACSGSYNAGKTERGETNVFIPWVHFEATVNRLKTRIAQKGSASITRPGEGFPGTDICKNCPLILFKKGKKED